MKHALITGGLGLIGSNVARNLIENNYVEAVVCLDHFGRYVSSVSDTFVDYRRLRIKGLEERVIIERGSAQYYSVVQNLLQVYQPEYIFHLAAQPLAKLSNLNSQEAMEGCVESTTMLLESIHFLSKQINYMPKKFVYASSSMVYGDFIEETAVEDVHPTNPKEIYGTMKLAGEIITKGLAKHYGIPFNIIRPSAVYGPTDMNKRVSQIFMEKALRGEVLKVHGANEKLDFTYVKDIAKGFVLAAISEVSEETFNITFGNSHTLNDYVNELQKHFPNLRYELTKRDEFRPKRGTLCTKKARDLLAYYPDYTLEKGIAEYYKFITEAELHSK